MALPRDAFRALEDILGPENISEEPAVLDGYAFAGDHSQPLKGPGAENRFYLRPEAVVLPGSTEEVQAVIKLCNRCKIKFKASSTG